MKLSTLPVFQERGADYADLADSLDSEEFRDPVVDKLPGHMEDSGNVPMTVGLQLFELLCDWFGFCIVSMCILW